MYAFRDDCVQITDVEQKYSREVLVISVNFSDGMEIYPNIAEQLQDLDVGILSKPNVQFLPQLYVDGAVVLFFLS